MKTLLSIFTLTAIVCAYVYSASLYMKGDMVPAYTLIISAIAGITLWIKTHEIVHEN
jgi:hypothetical protein